MFILKWQDENSVHEEYFYGEENCKNSFNEKSKELFPDLAIDDSIVLRSDGNQSVEMEYMDDIEFFSQYNNF